MTTLKIQRYEYECKCGCGLNNVSQALINRTRVARDIAGVPFVIRSGCRCARNNADAGGKDDSSHLIGEAEDIECVNSRHRFQIKYALYIAGFTRIGNGPDFIHADIDTSKDQDVEWNY